MHFDILHGEMWVAKELNICLVLVEMIKYLLVFVEMIKLQSYACLLFIIANKDTTEHFLELLMEGGSTELDFSCWLSGLNSEQSHQF